MAMSPRPLIVLQIASIALLGAVARGTYLSTTAIGWAESTVALGFYPVLLGFPLTIASVTRRSTLHRWKCWMILGIEVTLTLATLVAVLPLVQ